MQFMYLAFVIPPADLSNKLQVLGDVKAKNITTKVSTVVYETGFTTGVVPFILQRVGNQVTCSVSDDIIFQAWSGVEMFAPNMVPEGFRPSNKASMAITYWSGLARASFETFFRFNTDGTVLMHRQARTTNTELVVVSNNVSWITNDLFPN